MNHPTYSAIPPARRLPVARLFADTETIPTQRLDILQELTEKNHAERDVKLAELAPPKSLKKQETIDAWMENELPVKQGEINDEYAEKLREAIHKTCLDGAFGQLVCISLAPDDDSPTNLWDTNWSAPGYEAWLLNELHRSMQGMFGHHRGAQLVGHGIGFDRTMIRQRGIVLGAPVHAMFSKAVKPWENDAVFDTMTEWTGDPRKYISQDRLCKALGIDGKGTDLPDGEYIDGSQVWDFIQRGEIAKVAIYCGGDVVRARRLYRAITGMDARPAQPAFNPTCVSLTAEILAAPASKVAEQVQANVAASAPPVLDLLPVESYVAEELPLES